ncbi:MAG: glycosyltransferase [Candidatus Rokubacteria bacterium]|nr:glycosyltransferase [Candidatus Rokubacteria bacterium]
MRVGIHSTTTTACGIADYTRDLVAGLTDLADVRLVPVREPCRNPVRMLPVARALSLADVAHVQHNYGFWGRGSLSYRLAFETLMRALTVPAVVTAHSVRPVGVDRARPWHRQGLAALLGLDTFIDRTTFALADRVIVHSRAHRSRLVERGIPEDRVVEVMPGAPRLPGVPAGAVEQFRAAWGLGGRIVLALFGFIQPNKGCELAVDALQHLPKEFVLMLVGGVRTEAEAWYGAQLRERIERAGVDDRVRITGFLARSELAAALAAADVCVLPYGADDNVSYSARLCLAAEKALLASPLGGFAELCERFGCVELFTSTRPEAIATLVHEVVRDESRRAALVDGARRYCRERAWSRVAAETAAVYRSALERR